MTCQWQQPKYGQLNMGSECDWQGLSHGREAVVSSCFAIVKVCRYPSSGLCRAIDRVLDEVKQSQPDPLKRIAQGAESLFLFFAQNPERARILLVESSGLSPRLDKTRRSITRRQIEELRQMFESAPSLFTVEDTLIAARCVAGATFEAIYSWLEEDPKTRMPVAEVARAVARFNTQAVRKKPAKRESNSVMRSGSRKARWITVLMAVRF
jgi:hypothetical protein